MIRPSLTSNELDMDGNSFQSYEIEIIPAPSNAEEEVDSDNNLEVEILENETSVVSPSQTALNQRVEHATPINDAINEAMNAAISSTTSLSSKKRKNSLSMNKSKRSKNLITTTWNLLRTTCLT